MSLSKTQRLKGRVLGWLGVKLFHLGRLCLSKSQGHGRCWICSAAAGMGPIWSRSGVTCDHCYDRWAWVCDHGLIVDWRGIGRLPRNRRERARLKIREERLAALRSRSPP